MKPKFDSSKSHLEKKNMEVSWGGLELAPMGVEWDLSELFKELNPNPPVTVSSPVDVLPLIFMSLTLC